MPLAPGSRLGVYEITAPLGEGGMGAVYRARDTRLKRDVAIKVLLPEVANDPERLARFQREAEVLAALNHPNIAHIHGLEEAQAGQSGPFLVLELVEGPTLADRIAETRARGLPLDEALKIARQIAEALDAAHERGIIHRDLKPANIKVRDDGTVKVLDFGLAKALETPAGSENPGRPEAVRTGSNLTNSPTLTSPALMTGVGVLLGTAAYMSPEQARGRAIDKRADIWAFGCVLHEMLTGERLFRGDDITDTIAAIVRDTPDLSHAPREVRRLLRSCLEKDPRQRLRDLGDAWSLLDERVEPSPATAAIAPVTSSGRLAWIGWAVAIVATAAAALAFRSTPKPTSIPATRLDIAIPTGMTFGYSPTSPEVDISPDGRCLLFRGDAVDGSTGAIYRRCFDDVRSERISGTWAARGAGANPFFSEDGQSFGFFMLGKLMRTSISGGPVEALAEAENVRGAWNRAGDVLFTDRSGRIGRVSGLGGTVSIVTEFDPAAHEVAHRLPRFLPDGRHFLFVAQPDEVLKVGSLDSKESHALGLKNVRSPVYVKPGYILYVVQQTLVARAFDADRLTFTGDAVVLGSGLRTGADSATFSASDGGTLVYRQSFGRTVEVEWLDRSGALLGRPVSPGNYRGVEAVKSGGVLAVRRLDAAGNRSLWVVDTTRGTDVRVSNTGSEMSPRWSPDGQSLIFFGGRIDARGLYVKRMGTTRDPELVLASTAQANLNATDWSADGRVVLYEAADSATGTDIWSLPMTGSTHEPIPLLKTSSNEGQATLSTDGKWIAYTSDESGRLEVYVQPLPATGAKWQVSAGGGRQARWRRDGRELFYLSPSAAIMSVNVQPATNGFHVDTPRQLFQTRVGIQPGDVNPTADVSQFDVSPDGQRFLVMNLSSSADAEPLTVVLNWPELLKVPSKTP